MVCADVMPQSYTTTTSANSNKLHELEELLCMERTTVDAARRRILLNQKRNDFRIFFFFFPQVTTHVKLVKARARARKPNRMELEKY